MANDKLGHVDLPLHILELLSQLPPEKQTVEVVTDDDLWDSSDNISAAIDIFIEKYQMMKRYSMWTTVEVITGSNGTSKHKVEARLDNTNGIVLRCTCQGFRIAGKGISCKHTKLVAKTNNL